jgi:Rrf2 family protein
MRLTKQSSHAIRILIDCALAEGQLVKVADVSARLGITKQNVFKIVHLLSRAGFVGAVRGPNGGVHLAHPAHEIRIGDVIRAMEVTSMHVAGEPPSSNGDGADGGIGTLFDDALAAFVSVLDQHTLADLAGIDKTSRKSPGSTPKASPAPAQRPVRSPKSEVSRRN